MGSNLVPDKELQEFRTEAGTTTIQSHNKSQSYRSKAVVKQSGKENNSFQEGKYDGKYDCNIADGILGNSLLSLYHFSFQNSKIQRFFRYNSDTKFLKISISERKMDWSPLLHKSHQILLSILRLYTMDEYLFKYLFSFYGMR